MTLIKNLTQWRPPSGKGYVINVGGEYLVTNASSFLVTNAGANLVTNDTYVVPKYKTFWTGTGA